MGVKWGIIGCGMIADFAMIPAMKEARNCDLVSVMSRDEEKAKKFSAKHNIPDYHTDLDEFLKDPSLEAVYLATPPNVHCEQTTKVAEHGKHVLCEKPMAITIEDSKKMIEACNRAGVKLMIACNLRFHPVHIKAREIIQAGCLGKIVLIKAQMSYFYPPDTNWRIKPEIAGGGSLHDAGIHCIDLARFFTGEEVVQVSAFTGNVIFDYAVEDTALVLMKFTSGAYGFIETSYGAYYTENKFEVIGSKGTLFGERSIWGAKTAGRLRAFAGEAGRTHDVKFAPPWGQDPSLGGLGTVMKEYNLPPPCNTYTAEVEYFSECIMGDKEPEINGMQGLRDLQIVKAAYESAKGGKVITITS